MGSKRGNLILSQKLSPITSEQDRELLGNPNRGFRYETDTNLSTETMAGLGYHVNPAVSLVSFKNLFKAENPMVVRAHLYLSGFRNTPVIPQEGIDGLQMYFDTARSMKMTLLVRFMYNTNMNGTGEASQSIMLGHMKQLKPILEKNRDVIFVVQMGFLGAWGEWHAYSMEHDRVEIIRAVAEMAPVGKFLQIRRQDYKILIPATDPLYKRIGDHNDAVFGDEEGGIYGGCAPGTAVWNKFMAENPYVPVDGELFWGRWSLGQDFTAVGGRMLNGFDIIKQLSQHRYTTFSCHHNYMEDGADKKYSMQYWQETPITEKWLKDNNIIYAPGWFMNYAGKKTVRTVFDFVRDYVGYKLEAENVKATGKLTAGGNISVEMSFKNYGFSVPFDLESGFVILDESGKAVTSVKAGNPLDWHSRSPTNYNDGKVLTHTLKASCKLPNQPGKYKIAFYLKNELSVFARLGNDIDFVNGYNILGTFEF